MTPNRPEPNDNLDNDIEIKLTTWHDPDGIALRSRQRDEILASFPGEPGLPPSADDVLVFIILKDKATGEAIAGGGLRALTDDDDNDDDDNISRAEIKRMYVVPSHRGHSHGQRQGVRIADFLLQHLEREALRQGFTALRLETAEEMVRARRFYERNGFERISLYGKYRGSGWSVCYEKVLEGVVDAGRGEERSG